MTKADLRAALMVAAGLLLAVFVVDPWREFLSQDDGWAYARSVEHLLQTGRYELDAWSAANLPVQIYLGAGFAKVFGYSLSILRISTLVLLAAGLAGCYGLLRELGMRAEVAGLLTLGLLASPMVLMLAFTYMSDVPFMSWMLLSLWGYVRGLRRGSDRDLWLASLAAGCAIGTRQFGLALLGGLLLAWLAVRPQDRPPWRRLVIATAVPLMVAVVQLQGGYAAPNVTQAVRLLQQRHFLDMALPELGREGAWRTGILLQYLGLSLLPLFPVLAGVAWQRSRAALWPSGQGADHRRIAWHLLWVALYATFLAACLVGGSVVTARAYGSKILPLQWMLPNAFWDHRWLMSGLAIGGFAGAVLMALPLLFGARTVLAPWRRVEWLLLSGVGLGLLGLHLSYVQLNDTYVVGLLPFALLLTVLALAATSVPQVCRRLAVASCFTAILLASLWMRGEYNRQEALWSAAESLLSRGVDIQCIGGGRHWSEYHGAFDRWIATEHFDLAAAGAQVSPMSADPFHDPFYDWLHERFWDADFQVPDALDPEIRKGWHVYERIPYRNVFLGRREVYTLVRDVPRQPRGLPCKGAE